MRAVTTLGLAAMALVILSLTGAEKPSFVPIVFQETARTAGIEFVLKNHATPNKYQIEVTVHALEFAAVRSASPTDFSGHSARDRLT